MNSVSLQKEKPFFFSVVNYVIFLLFSLKLHKIPFSFLVIKDGMSFAIYKEPYIYSNQIPYLFRSLQTCNDIQFDKKRNMVFSYHVLSRVQSNPVLCQLLITDVDCYRNKCNHHAINKHSLLRYSAFLIAITRFHKEGWEPLVNPDIRLSKVQFIYRYISL